MSSESISQAELARRLNRTDRQVRNLTEEHGLPRNPDGTYPWPESHEWFVRFKQDERERRTGNGGEGLTELDQARAEKERALAGLRQLDLEKALGNMVSLDFHLEKLEVVFGIIRKRLENLPSMAPRFVGLDTAAEAQEKLEQVRNEMMEALRRVADELELDDNDSPDGDSELAA